MSKYREICLRQRIWICLKLHVYDVPEHGGKLQCLETKKVEMWQQREQVQRRENKWTKVKTNR